MHVLAETVTTLFQDVTWQSTNRCTTITMDELLNRGMISVGLQMLNQSSLNDDTAVFTHQTVVVKSQSLLQGASTKRGIS